MGPALARHNALAREAVESYGGKLMKITGDGVYASFDDSVSAIRATLQLQQSLVDAAATNGIQLQVRCGLHLGVAERVDNDYFGPTVNRAARIMSAAHGGQVLLSEAIAGFVRDRLPEGVTLRDLGFVRLRDLANPEHLYQIIHPQLRQDFPALRSLEATPNNLPHQATSFIGRERELTELKELLAKTPLLTLLGAGGLGKTRLSLQVAADIVDDFPDGVWFVEFAPLEDARLVPQAVASVLGVKEEAGRSALEALVRHVKDRKLLLILDNCEHLLQACAELTRTLVKAGAQLKIVTSSREPLRVTGEATYPVSTLAVPDPRLPLTPAGLNQYEAVRVFIDRAIAARPGFAATDQNAHAIADICCRLDGIPLALELAAARARTLPVESIASRLNDRFRLLTGGDRTALPRQQTLRASIEWSYDLLSDAERTLLRRLAVFSGGWTLEATEAVCSLGEDEAFDVLDLLTQLTEKSLTVLDVERGRYRLLETVRQYAQEKLNESGEGDAVRTRHLAFFLALAEEADPALFGPEQGEWQSRLDLERENFLSAHAWCDRAGDGPGLGLRLVYALRNYWWSRGLEGLGRSLTKAALVRAGAERSDLFRCRALAAAGQHGYYTGYYDEAQAYLDESLLIAREIGDRERIAIALTLLGHVAIGQGNPDVARVHYTGALALARELGDKRRLSNTLNALGVLYSSEGDLDNAEPLYQESLKLDRERGDHEAVAQGLSSLACVAIRRGHGDRGRNIALEALAIAENLRSKGLGLLVLDIAIELAAYLHEWEKAVRFYGASEKHREQFGLHREPADSSFLEPLLARLRETLGPSAFGEAEAAGRALSYEEAMRQLRPWLEAADNP
jgi:predicted ATPase